MRKRKKIEKLDFELLDSLFECKELKEHQADVAYLQKCLDVLTDMMEDSESERIRLVRDLCALHDDPRLNDFLIDFMPPTKYPDVKQDLKLIAAIEHCIARFGEFNSWTVMQECMKPPTDAKATQARIIALHDSLFRKVELVRIYRQWYMVDYLHKALMELARDYQACKHEIGILEKKYEEFCGNNEESARDRELTLAHEELARDREELTLAHEELTRVHEELTLTREELVSVRASRDASQVRMQKELDDLAQNIQRLGQSATNLGEKLELSNQNFGQKIRTLEAEKQQAIGELQRRMDELAQTRQQIVNLEQQIVESSQKLTETEQQLTESEQRLKRSETGFQQTPQCPDLNIPTFGDIQKLGDEQKHPNAELVNANAELTLMCKEMKHANVQLQTRCDQHEEELKCARIDQMQWRSKYEQLQQVKLKTDSELTDALSSRQMAITEERNALQALKMTEQERVDARKEVDALSVARDYLSNKLSERQDKLSALSLENDKLRKELETANYDKEMTRASVKFLQDEVNQLKQTMRPHSSLPQPAILQSLPNWASNNYLPFPQPPPTRKPYPMPIRTRSPPTSQFPSRPYDNLPPLIPIPKRR
jgi:hypothetical protein